MRPTAKVRSNYCGPSIEIERENEYIPINLDELTFLFLLYTLVFLSLPSSFLIAFDISPRAFIYPGVN